MDTFFIHISDLHFRENWEEDQDVLLSGFFDDLEKQIGDRVKTNVYIVFSGDIVLAGGNEILYEKFTSDFSSQLDKIGITRDQRICVPGNHDLNIQEVSKVNHKAIIKLNLNEKDFNDYIDSSDFSLNEKFANYSAFQSVFSKYHISNKQLTGEGHFVTENIAIYCLNSAIFSGQSSTEDKGNLRVDTRSLNRWNTTCKAKYKILVMHHPIEWLNDWSQRELNKLINKDFCLLLHGHSHDQNINRLLPSRNGGNVRCSAPPLLTNKHEDLGYSIVKICEEIGVKSITYRQWTKFNSFVPGVNFSNNETGIVEIHGNDSKELDNKFNNHTFFEATRRIIENRYNQALELYPSQPKIWVDPVIKNESESSSDSEKILQENNVISINGILSSEKFILIKSQEQFGASSLAHHICKTQWEERKKLWLIIDFKNLNQNKIEKAIQKELETFGVDTRDVSGIVVDSWSRSHKLSIKSIEIILEKFNESGIVIFESSSNAAKFSNRELILNGEIKFSSFYLSTLTRNKIRDLVSQYNAAKGINEDDIILKKLISDLNILNLHRTPLNCLTLLKVAEVDFDESPVNRTEVIRRILFLLFNSESLPTYKIRPDLKDCEHTLGWFCEQLIRDNNLIFSRERFIKDL